MCRGDQGFLNSFFPTFAAAPMFDPETTAVASAGEPSFLHRLPTAYVPFLAVHLNLHAAKQLLTTKVLQSLFDL